MKDFYVICWKEIIKLSHKMKKDPPPPSRMHNAIAQNKIWLIYFSVLHNSFYFKEKLWSMYYNEYRCDCAYYTTRSGLLFAKKTKTQSLHFIVMYKYFFMFACLHSFFLSVFLVAMTFSPRFLLSPIYDALENEFQKENDMLYFFF